MDAPPPQSVSDRLLRIVSNRGFVRPTGYPKRSVPAIPWAGLLSKSRSVSSPALSSLRLPVQQGTHTSTPCGDCWVGPAADTPAPASPGRPTAWRPVSFLYLGVSPFCGQQRSVWKCSSDSPVCGFNESSNPGLFSQHHLESSPVMGTFKTPFSRSQKRIPPVSVKLHTLRPIPFCSFLPPPPGNHHSTLYFYKFNICRFHI